MEVMFRLFFVIACVSAGMPAQRSIVRDDGLRAREPEERSAEKVQSLSQEDQDVQASGSLATESTKEGADAENEVESGSDVDAADKPDDTPPATEAGDDDLDKDEKVNFGALFKMAEDGLKKIMTRIKELSATALNQQAKLINHKKQIKDLRSKYNRLVEGMKNKMAALKTNVKKMQGGLGAASEASLKTLAYINEKSDKEIGISKHPHLIKAGGDGSKEDAEVYVPAEGEPEDQNSATTGAAQEQI